MEHGQAKLVILHTAISAQSAKHVGDRWAWAVVLCRELYSLLDSAWLSDVANFLTVMAVACCAPVETVCPGFIELMSTEARKIPPTLGSVVRCAVCCVGMALFVTLPARADDALRAQLHRVAPRIPQKVLDLALKAAACAKSRRDRPSPYLAIIDYSLPSTSKRFWLLDLQRRTLLLEELVAHGKGSGSNLALRFSNEPGSLQTSIGLYSTGPTYQGRHGHSMILHGLEKGFNDKALERAIVMHGAPYVSEKFIKQWRRLGRSWGCPALGEAAALRAIDYLKDGSLLFAYFPDRRWLRESEFLNRCIG